ncbi:hypothetical protein PAHAL_5G086700 [Panicum hallii]|uniref:Uncharacterized protein n=1 Tax=Panicum hallii TaxID=206008 RepID=A0A2T8IJB3_9POAL|nr:hypothetical protein PAHAL_5G086700 [Panicum hallii]
MGTVGKPISSADLPPLPVRLWRRRRRKPSRAPPADLPFPFPSCSVLSRPLLPARSLHYCQPLRHLGALEARQAIAIHGGRSLAAGMSLERIMFLNMQIMPAFVFCVWPAALCKLQSPECDRELQ